MTASVRQARKEDVEALVVLNRSVQELHIAHQPDYFKDADSKSVADWFGSMLRNSAVCVWVAELKGSPVGYALTIDQHRPETPFASARRFCEIDQIAVLPAFRRTGVARALIERVLENARLHSIPDVELSSWCFNGHAHETFRALGFTGKVTRFARKVD